jgi:hypothetical protein
MLTDQREKSWKNSLFKAHSVNANRPKRKIMKNWGEGSQILTVSGSVNLLW